MSEPHEIAEALRSLQARLNELERKIQQLTPAHQHPSPYVHHYPGNQLCTCMYCRQPVTVPDWTQHLDK